MDKEALNKLSENELKQVSGGTENPNAAFVTCDGKVAECLPNQIFVVELENGSRIRATLSGKLRLNYIKIIVGDQVQVKMSCYGDTSGEIIWQNK